jgi:hypothetical protein
MRKLSLAVAVEVLRQAHAQGVARRPMPKDPEAYIQSLMFDPTYDKG